MAHIPYTYLIGWSKLNLYYYGVRFAKDCDPSDLWKTYFTSSKKVKALRLTSGEPDIIQVRKTFTETTKARLWESKVIKKLDMPSNKMWLNQSDHNDKFYHEGPRGKFTDQHKQKMREARLGTVQSEETVNKRVSKNTGKKRTESQKITMSAAQKNKVYSDYDQWLINIKKANSKKTGSEMAKETARLAGKKSAENRKQSDYYQSEEWKNVVKRGWEKRRANKLEKTMGGIV